MDLSKVSIMDLVDELQGRTDVEYVINERSSRDWAMMIEDGKWAKGTGEIIILAVKGLF